MTRAAGAGDDDLADGLMLLIDGAFASRLISGEQGIWTSVRRAGVALIRRALGSR